MLSALTTKLIIAGVVLAVLGGVGLYIRSIINENAVLLGNQRELETALELRVEEVLILQDQARSNRFRAIESQKHIRAAQAKVDDLEELLSKHDLPLLVKRKPGLMTKVFERGTAAVHTEIEEAANATLID